MVVIPFVAFCKKCGNYLDGEKFWNIRADITKHFKESHGKSPDPDINRVIFNRDFEENEVYLESSGINAPAHPYTFLSRLFCSDDYCVAVIIWDDYSYLQRRLEGEEPPEEKKKSLELTLWPYFPREHRSKFEK